MAGYEDSVGGIDLMLRGGDKPVRIGRITFTPRGDELDCAEPLLTMPKTQMRYVCDAVRAWADRVELNWHGREETE